MGAGHLRLHRNGSGIDPAPETSLASRRNTCPLLHVVT